MAKIVSFAWLVLIIVVFSLSDKPQISQKIKAVQHVEKKGQLIKEVKDQNGFKFTIEEFLQRYNQAFSVLGRNIKASIKEENNNGKYLTIQALTNNKNIGLVVQANNKTRKVQLITFIGSGDGTIQSGLDVVFGVSAVVMAIEDPNMPVEQRGEIVKALGLSNGKLSELGKLSAERNGTKYSISLSDSIGTWLVAEPI